MIDQLIQQLQDADPAVRRRAIIALGRSKDGAALSALAGIVRSDPDPALRDLARKAGQYIRRQQTPTTAADADAAPSAAPDATSAPTAPLASRYKRLSDEIPPVVAAEPPDEDHSPFMRPTTPQPIYDPYASLADDDVDDLPDPPLGDDPEQFMRPAAAEDPALDDERRRLEDELPDPTFGDEPSLDGLLSESSDQTSEKPADKPHLTIVRGRQYEVPREDRVRAKAYVDGALALSMNGDNAKAIHDLTEALSLDPNLINNGFFNNVAATVTGLDGDAAAQLIIDRNERKRFAEAATRNQEARRVEQHMLKAEQPTWPDVWFELGLYTLIVVIGALLTVLVMSESVRNLLANFPQVSGDLPEQLQSAQASFEALSFGALLPIGVFSGISGVVSLLVQTVLIHYAAKMLGGVGTWRYLIQVLLGFYNKWFPILFFILYLTIAIAFGSLFSPVVLCLVIVLVVLSLYVSGKTSSKVGEAYDFGAAKGCLTLIASALIIGLINAGISYLMVQTLGLAFTQLMG